MASDNFIIGGALQEQRQTIFDTPETLGNYLDAQIKSSFVDSWTFGLYDYARRPETGKILSRAEIEELNNGLGIVSDDVPDQGMPYDQWQFEAKRQLTRKNLQEVVARKPDTAISTALGLGAAFIPAVADPVALPLNFLPVVGPARYSKLLATQTTLAGRAAVRFGLGAVEGGVSAALMEPFSYALFNSLGDDYTSYDSFMNIAFGIGFGGTVGSGFGLVGDTLNKNFGGIASPLSKEQNAEILQAVSEKLMRDGKFDVEPLMNAAMRSRLMYSLSEAEKLPDFFKKYDGNPVILSKQRAREEFLKNNPDINARIFDLEEKLKAVQPKQAANIYDRALNDYVEARNMEIKTPQDEIIQTRKLADLDKRYGKNFEQEAKDYEAYVAKQEKLKNNTDKRNIRSLQRDIEALDKKYNGRLSDAYSKKYEATGSPSVDEFAIRQQLDEINQQNALGVEMQYLRMKDMYAKQLQEEKVRFATTADRSQFEKLSEQVVVMEKQIKDTPDVDFEGLADEIDALKTELDDFKTRTGIDINDIDDAEFNVQDKLDTVKKYLDCIRR